MIRRAVRTAFRAMVRRVARLAARNPHRAYRIADLMALLRPTLARQDVTRVFPELSAGTSLRVVQAMRRTFMRNHILIECIRTAGMEPVRTIVRENQQLAALRPPLVLGTFHLGALPALGAALERLDGEVFVLRGTPPNAADVTPALTIEMTAGDEQRRALVFHMALERLGAGGFVFMPLDPEQAVRVPAPFRGRKLQLARGPFAMARIQEVPILPIVARWRDGSIDIVLGDLVPPADESTMAAAVAAWLERYLMEHPLEISPRVLALTM